MSQVKVYGADWCPDTQHTLERLKTLGVDLQYINIEEDAAAANWVKEQNNGKERKPTVDVAGQVLSVPEDDELEAALRDKGLIPLKGF